MHDLRKTRFLHYVGRYKVTCERRAETNEEIMTQALLRKGVIKLRVVLQIQRPNGKFVGYQGSGFTFEVGSIKEAREVLANLKKSLQEE